MVVADEANFGARKRHATSKLVAELVIEMGATIDGDGIGLMLGFFLHSLIIAYWGAWWRVLMTFCWVVMNFAQNKIIMLQ